MDCKAQIEEEFARLIGDERIEEMNAYPDSVYGLWKDSRIAYLNPAWFRFAAENGGEPAICERWGLGSSLADCIPEVLKERFEIHLYQCAHKQAPSSYEYECSSDTVYRLFHQTIYPVGELQGFLIVNTLIIQKPHGRTRRPLREADVSDYVNRQGLVQQCSNCRRVMHRGQERYHWVPEWVKQPLPHPVHSLCKDCSCTLSN